MLVQQSQKSISSQVDRGCRKLLISLPRNPYVDDYSYNSARREEDQLSSTLKSLIEDQETNNCEKWNNRCDKESETIELCKKKPHRIKSPAEIAYHRSLAVRYEQLLLRYMLLRERIPREGLLHNVTSTPM
ncbi:hypothetical protein K7432_013250 [Basidiobolus ranarum]|uniref:Uncharacterized protein n=1 Tax=Basidiobolus ranarum TaxID=34480 RepID=A0ABR2VRI7_9FUNG